ncbi:MAG: molecular chaperone TorD family protein [Chloroflexi bacterium]|nr:molecular chaperone TorD family protein [Chloroflexota bacterium]
MPYQQRGRDGIIDQQAYFPELDEGQTAKARGAGYHFLGQLFRRGVSAADVSQIERTPILAMALPSSVDPDTLAAVHYQLFGMNVFPFESIFLDDSGLLGGWVTDGVVHSYQRIGFAADTAVDSADHIGHELAAMAALCQVEAEAREENLTPLITSRQTWQREFLEEHLLRWLPSFVLAVRQQGDDFFTAVANLTLELTAHHYDELVETPTDPGLFLPPAPDILADEKTSLKDIARYLVTPAYSGLYFSRDDVSRLARRLELPRGFGDRQQMLVNLLRTAVQYDQLSAVINGLISLSDWWQGAYWRIGVDYPKMAGITAVWQGKAAKSGQILAQMAAQTREIGEP